MYLILQSPRHNKYFALSLTGGGRLWRNTIESTIADDGTDYWNSTHTALDLTALFYSNTTYASLVIGVYTDRFIPMPLSKIKNHYPEFFI